MEECRTETKTASYPSNNACLVDRREAILLYVTECGDAYMSLGAFRFSAIYLAVAEAGLRLSGPQTKIE